MGYMAPTGVYMLFNDLQGLNTGLRSGKPKKPETELKENRLRQGKKWV